jgi:hypothetical protein
VDSAAAKTGRLGFYRWTTVAMGMMMSSFPSLLGSKVATGTLTSSHPSLLCFSYFNELVKSLIKMLSNGKIIYYLLN